MGRNARLSSRATGEIIDKLRHQQSTQDTLATCTERRTRYVDVVTRRRILLAATIGTALRLLERKYLRSCRPKSMERPCDE